MVINLTTMDISLKLIGACLLMAVPALLVAGTFYFIIRSFLRRDRELKLIELRVNTEKDTRLLRLQAYERMVIFLERIDPSAVIQRVIDSDMLSHDLQLAMIRTVRAEYEHNLSQQVYISSDAWRLIASAKEEIIKMVSLIGSRVPSDTTGQQLSRIMLEAIANSGQTLPTQTALEYLKEEARQYL